MNVDLSAALVERCAQAAYLSAIPEDRRRLCETWDTLPEYWRRQYRRQVEAVLHEFQSGGVKQTPDAQTQVGVCLLNLDAVTGLLGSVQSSPVTTQEERDLIDEAHRLLCRIQSRLRGLAGDEYAR